MTIAFSRAAWDRNAELYELIRTMPFNAELAQGTLSQARFKHYITQDAHYLIGFGRALTLAAAKAPDPTASRSSPGRRKAPSWSSGRCTVVLCDWGIRADDFAATPLSPACHHYVSYLLATAYAEPYEVLLGALLPCFWIYAEVGRDIHARASSGNPYQPGSTPMPARRSTSLSQPSSAPPTRRRRAPRTPFACACMPPSARHAARMDVLGFGLSIGGVAGVSGAPRRYVADMGILLRKDVGSSLG